MPAICHHFIQEDEMNYPQILTHQEELERNVEFILQTIKSNKIKFDFIIARGISGIIPSAIVAHKLRKQLCVVRKEQEKTHSKNKIEIASDFYPATKRYIIIDDLIDTGETVVQIVKSARNQLCMNNFMPAAIILYGTDYNRDFSLIDKFITNELQYEKIDIYAKPE